jgi:hypothetical protein
MACYDFDYAMQILIQAIDFAEIEHDFVPLRKWANEVEQSGCEIKAIEYPAGQDVLLAILQLVASGSLSPEEAGQRIRLWLNHNQEQDQRVELIKQCQFA